MSDTMKYILLVLPWSISLLSNAGTQVYFFDKEVSLPGECVYYVRNVVEGGFSCAVGPESYEVKFSTIEAVGEHYALVESDIDKSGGSKLVKQKIRDYSHYYFHLNQSGLEGFFYTVCSSAACFTVLSLDKGLFLKVLSRFDIELVEHM